MNEDGIMEEVPYDETPGTGAAELADHFIPLRVSPAALDQVSKIVPVEKWRKVGIYTWTKGAAQHVFDRLTSDQLEGKLGILKMKFEFDKDGPLLKSVSLG
jgi:hypothetical protein